MMRRTIRWPCIPSEGSETAWCRINQAATSAAGAFTTDCSGKSILIPTMRDFKANRSFFVDATLNLVGFIPLGAVLFGWLKALRPRSGKVGILAIVGLLLSAQFEYGDPTSVDADTSSSLLDLTLNTLGAWLGICLFERTMRIGWLRS